MFPLQYLAAPIAAFSELWMGFMYGWPSIALPMLTSETWPWRITSSEAAWVVSLLDLGYLVTPFLSGILADRWGRRTVLLLATLPVIVSWIMIISANSVWWLYASRLLAGFGIGMVFTVNTMYRGEICGPGFRGKAFSMSPCMGGLGVLLVNSAGLVLPFQAVAWIGMLLLVLFFVTFYMMPESPYYLLMRGRQEEAKEALRKLRGSKTDEKLSQQFIPLQKSLEENMCKTPTSARDFFKLVFSPGIRRAFLLTSTLGALQKFTGHSSVIAYTSSTLPKSVAAIGPVMLSGVQFLSSLVALFLMDRLGRRPLLIGSASVGVVSMIASGIFYHLESLGNPVTSLIWLPMTALFLYALAFPLGVGPIPDILLGEVFPPSIKSFGIAFSDVSFTVFNFLVTKMYQVVKDGIGVQYVYWSFAFVGILTVIFGATVMPETRGKTLEKIVEELKDSDTKSKRNRSNDDKATAV